MLEKVREPWRAKNVIAYIIFGFICFIFVFVGIVPDQGAVSGAGTAATVNDIVIPVSDFQERVSMIESQMGQGFNSLPAKERQQQTQRLRQNALDELVNYELVYQSAEKAGVLPTAAATRDLIMNVPAFQEDGRFARQLYDRYLAYRNYSASQFESKVQRDVVIGQTRELFMTALKTPQVVDKLTTEVRETKLNLEFVKIEPQTLEKTLAADPAGVNAFLAKEENKTKVKNYYEGNKSTFTSEAEVRARHILIKGDTAESKAKAEDLRKQAEKGDFAQLATQHSEDEGSKTRGGDLNFFKRGQMVKEFEDVAFQLPIGQLSELVKTNYGYHIIKVEERRGGETKPLESVQNEIATKLLAEEGREKALQDLTQSLKNPKALSEMVAKWKLKWEETGEFTLSSYAVPKIDAGEEALAVALTLKTPGEVAPELVRAGPVSYVLRLKQFTPAKPNAEQSPAFAFSSPGAEALGRWVEELKKEARIRKNEQLVSL